MTKMMKLIRIILPALALAATVGLTATGCSDDTTTKNPQDMAVAQDLNNVTGDQL